MTANRLPLTANRNMYYRFENLEVWKIAREFVSEIYRITRNFPKDELFGLTSQIRRATISISLNIAEGSNRKSDLDFRRFLRIANSSLEEVITGLYIALDQKLINKEDFDKLYKHSHELSAKMNALINKLNNSNSCKQQLVSSEQ